LIESLCSPLGESIELPRVKRMVAASEVPALAFVVALAVVVVVLGEVVVVRGDVVVVGAAVVVVVVVESAGVLADAAGSPSASGAMSAAITTNPAALRRRSVGMFTALSSRGSANYPVARVCRPFSIPSAKRPG